MDEFDSIIIETDNESYPVIGRYFYAPLRSNSRRYADGAIELAENTMAKIMRGQRKIVAHPEKTAMTGQKYRSYVKMNTCEWKIIVDVEDNMIGVHQIIKATRREVALLKNAEYIVVEEIPLLTA